jgi:thiopeptide-type bacteriocin biosynthesis protein
MPTTDLIPTQARLVALVEAVVSGQPLDDIATRSGVDRSDLEAAVAVYRLAGAAAVCAVHETPWFHANLTMADHTTADQDFAIMVVPQLDTIPAPPDNPPTWWYLRKHPHWRVRILTDAPDLAADTLNRLVTSGAISAWKQSIYEPEEHAFGGGIGTQVIHDLFCADSRGVLSYAAGLQPLGRRETSLLLIGELLHSAGLDWFESADVFARVAAVRPSPSVEDHDRVARLASTVRPLLAMPPHARSELFGPTGQLSQASSWRDGYLTAGRELRAAADAGALTRGPRAVIAQAIIFAWNRLGLAARTQGVLAVAARDAILTP